MPALEREDSEGVLGRGEVGISVDAALGEEANALRGSRHRESEQRGQDDVRAERRRTPRRRA